MAFLHFNLCQSPVPLSSVRLSHDPNALLSLVIQVESSNMGSVAARVTLYQTVGTYLAPWKTSTSLRVNLEISPLSMWCGLYLIEKYCIWNVSEKIGVWEGQRNPLTHTMGHGSVLVQYPPLISSVTASKFKDKDEKTGQRKPWMRF